MPTYDYLCDDCKHRFQTVQSIMAQPLHDCPECSHPSLHRVIHAVSVLSRGEPKTVMQQADRNEKQMGRFQLEDKRQEVKDAADVARGGKKRPKPQRPFWRKTDKVNTELAKIAPKVTVKNGEIVEREELSQKAVDYIMTGKQP
jgi:putative FmdB family regulatory protein